MKRITFFFCFITVSGGGEGMGKGKGRGLPSYSGARCFATVAPMVLVFPRRITGMDIFFLDICEAEVWLFDCSGCWL